jgi:protocatechuate 3,4-dioxygenase beta subunit
MSRWTAPIIVVVLSAVLGLAWLFWPASKETAPTPPKTEVAAAQRGPEHPMDVPAHAPAIAPATARGGLHGEVVDADGKPIAGANIAWRDAAAKDGTAGRVSFVSSDAAGKFDIGAEGPFNWDVSVGAADHTDAHATVASLEGAWVTQKFTLAGGEDVIGTVEDLAGKPIAGAKVAVHRCKPGLKCVDSPLTQTGPDGRFETKELERGISDLVVTADKKQTLRTQVRAPDRAVKLVMQDKAVASGRVVDGSGAPVSDAQILIEGPLGEDAVPAARDAANNNGDFKVLIDGPGKYRLTALAAKPDGTSTGAGVQEVDIGPGGVGGITLKVEAGLDIGGVVLAPKGNPVPGATVFAARPGDPDLEGQRHRIDQGQEPARSKAVTAQNGTFSLRGLTPGTYQVWATTQEGSSPSMAIVAGASNATLQMDSTRR